MKNVDDLIASAGQLARQGRSRGEIADELNVSRETASWLVERSNAEEPDESGAERSSGDGPASASGPEDIHVDWSAVGRSSARLTHVGRALSDHLASDGVDLTVGVEKAGVPLATVVAGELDTDLATYTPAKHQWEEGDIEDLGGSFSRNFAAVGGRDCYIVDDTVTSGTTLRETVEAVRAEGGSPVGCSVLVDKQGLDSLADVPVTSLVDVVRVGDESGGGGT